MLTLTEAAGSYLEWVLSEGGAPDGTYVRVQLQKDGSGDLTLTQERRGDTKIEYQGRTVLVLDRLTASHLTDRTLDAEGSGEKRRLVLR